LKFSYVLCAVTIAMWYVSAVKQTNKRSYLTSETSTWANNRFSLHNATDFC